MKSKYNKKELEILYKKFKSMRKVAKELNIPNSTLWYYFNKYDIQVLKPKVKKDDIIKLLKELGSVRKVAEKLNISYSSIYYYIDKYKIEIIKNRFPYTKEELITLHEKYGSITKVASILSRSYSTVRHWYKELNIIINSSGMTVFQELRNTPMSDTHKSVIIGSMLGDGCLRRASHSKNALLEISHCEKQLGYLKWVHGLLQPFARPIKQTETAGKKMVCGREVDGSNFYRFYTIAHPDITDVFNTYYRKGLKGIDNSLIDKVDLIAMAIWFADDGSINRDKNKEPVSCSIATCSFTYKEHLIAVEIVRKFFNGTIKIAKHGGYYKGKKREDYVLNMSGKKHVNDFLDTIKLILPECIHYKLS